MKKLLFLLTALMYHVVFTLPRKLPYVPEVVYPPVPEHEHIQRIMAIKSSPNLGVTAEKAQLNLDQLKVLQETEQDPEVKPGLFQGDMALTNELYDFWRVGIRFDIMPERMWQNNTVPYVISPLYDTTDYVTIYKAILTLNAVTCIKFVPWNGKAKDFLLIWPMKFPQGCWSYVGRFGGPQILSLQPPDAKGPNCLGAEGRSIHELLHALGIFHEQSRADRDEFVDVHIENVIPEFLVNFSKESPDNTTYKFEYDYESIMHYGKFYFSKGKGQPTIVPKKKGVKLGQRNAMSKTDCLKINDLYGCLDKSLYHRRKYYTLCSFMGL